MTTQEHQSLTAYWRAKQNAPEWAGVTRRASKGKKRRVTGWRTVAYNVPLNRNFREGLGWPKQ